MQATYRWQSVDGPGLEHLSLEYREDVIVADAVVIGERGDGAFGCSYRICCDLGWRVRSLELHTAGAESLVLTSDGEGNWRDGDGAAQPHLSGCIDVDIAATPFTNTLPIRRLGASLQQHTSIAVVYIPTPSLAARRAEQAYTRLDDGRYLYESLDSSFKAELEVDADGLVLRYPSLFTRLDGP
jgi:hypothetical protein